MTQTTVAPRATHTAVLVRLAAAGREQLAVTSGQVAAGVGNLAFIAVAARVLDARAFSQVAAFVALHTLLHLPGAGLAALCAFDPSRYDRLTRRCATAGAFVGLALALRATDVAHAAALPVSLVYALAASAPAAPLLGLARGVAYGRRRHRALVQSLLIEPTVRCTLGVGLALVAGAHGAGWAVVAGGWLALASLTLGRREQRFFTDAATPALRTGGVATGGAFMLLALLQQQDLIVANRLLHGADAGAFAALSTIGGLVAFATSTVPFVLLAPSARRDRARLVVALGGAAAIGLAAVATTVVAPDVVIRYIVGERYSAIAPYLPAYVAAMTALACMRVLAANGCTAGRARRVLCVATVVAVGEFLALVLFGRSVAAVTAISVSSLTTGTIALVAPLPSRHTVGALAERLRTQRARELLFLAALVVISVAVRVATNRSLWLDEATSVAQARMPFGSMMRDLRLNDVHPPLYHVVLWATTRVFGTSELAIRAPSIAAGALTVPALYALAHELFDRRTARVVALLAVPAPFLVWYSQEARMYALFMLAGVCSLWAQLVAMRTGRPRAFVAWGVAAAALVWTQWFGLLPVAVQFAGGASAVLHARHTKQIDQVLDQPCVSARRLAAGCAGAGAAFALLLAPIVPLLLDQIAAYRVRGAGLNTTPSAVGMNASGVARDTIGVYAVIANGVWAVIGYHGDRAMEQLGALWPLGMLAALAVLGRRTTSRTNLVVAVAILPAVALLAIGTMKRDLFELRYFALLAPLLLLLVARMVTTLTRGHVLAVVIAVLVAGSTVALVDQEGNGTNPRLYDFRGAVHDIVGDAGPNADVALEPPYLDSVVHYYGPQLHTTRVRGLDASTVDANGIDVLVTQRFIGSQEASAMVGRVLYELEERFGPPQRIERPNVIVWRFR